VGFALGLWLVHSLEIAVFSGFAGIAITGIADYQGGRLVRLAAVSASALLGVVLVTLGTAMATQPVWSEMIVIFLVVSAVAFARVAGGYALAGADAVTLFYLVASGSPAPGGALPSRLAGVALGGALALVVTCLQPDRDTALGLGRLLAQLIAESAGRIHDVVEVRPSSLPNPSLPNEENEEDEEDEDEVSGRVAPMGIRARIDRRPDRPTGPVPSQRAALYLMNDLERLDGLVTRLEQSGPTPTPSRRALASLSARLAEAASLLSGPDGPDSPDAGPSFLIGEGFGMLARLSLVTQSVVIHAHAFGGSREERGWVDPRGVEEFVVHAGRRLRANLTLHSVRLQDSVRLGLGLAVGVLTIHLLDLPHGFWVALATLSVVKSDARRTGRSLAEAVVGTAVGFAIAAGVIVAIGSRPGWLAAALPLSLFAAFYAKGALSFLVGQAAFTMAVLVMFNLLAPLGWSLGVVRLEDVAAGALIGLAVGVLAWPRGAEASIGWITSRLVDASSDYLVAAVGALRDAPGQSGPSHAVGPGAAPDHRLQSALDAAVLADDALAELLEETADRTGARRWAEAISFGNRMRYAGDVITAQGPHTALSREALERAGVAADLLEQACHRLAAGLGGRGPVTRADPPDGTPVRSQAHDDLTRWIDDLATSAAEVLTAAHD